MGVLLWPDGEVRQLRTMISPRTAEDLQLEAITEAMAPGSYWRMSVTDLSRLWTDDPEVICHRQAVLRDFWENPELEGLMEGLLDSIDTWESHSGRSVRTAHDRMPWRAPFPDWPSDRRECWRFRSRFSGSAVPPGSKRSGSCFTGTSAATPFRPG